MDDETLFEAFTTYRLTHAEWTHEAHLRVAFLFLSRHALDEAHLRLRAGIIRLNERHGLVETGERGYFETLTRVWLALVDDARRRTGATSSREVLERCPELLDREAPLRFYTKETLRSVRARSVFVPPELSALP